MLGQFLFAYFFVGVLFVAFAGGTVRRTYRDIAKRESRGYAFALTFSTVLYVIVLWPYAVFDAMRSR
jgi:hypothetical protein